jgi:hypothetical protein
MSAQNTLNNLESFCQTNSGNPFIWQGKSGTYQWKRGKDTATGLVNGVVRKLAGIDASGLQIWVVAGSFKIDPNGSILRFTGLSKSDQKTLNSIITIPATVLTHDLLQPEHS